VARAIFGIIFKNLRASCKYVDCGLISNKYKGFFVKWQEFLGFGIIFQWEKVVDSVHGLVDHAGVASPRFHHGLHSGRQQGLTGARPNGRSGPRQLAASVEMGRARHGATRGPFTGARTMVRRWHTAAGL
jgi:hypothetical protein